MFSAESGVRRTVSSSFRDPSGRLYWDDGRLLREIAPCYVNDYRWLIASGLYQKLAGDGLLIEHKELETLKVIEPEIVPFISYPYEWCFSELKDAALATLRIEKTALEYGMMLKDASAYNIQFIRGKPILIDTLSFVRYQEGQPWSAYKQFCQHFLAPLALMACRDVRLSQLSRVYIDGIPLDLASKLLPLRTRLDFGIGAHIHANSLGQRYLSGSKVKGKMSKGMLSNLVEHLERTVQSLGWKPVSGWKDYMRECSYDEVERERKGYIVEVCLRIAGGKTAWDLGCNVGLYSQVASDAGYKVVAIDSDPSCVEILYNSRKLDSILPLVVDLTNPSPNIGWMNKERDSLLARAPADCIMALALMHHLIIGNNVPMRELAEFFGQLGRFLIIEFVPKEDLQVRRMLMGRDDIFQWSKESFEEEFSRVFSINTQTQVMETDRIVYLMERK